MDIDEFLDREISGLGLQTDKAGKRAEDEAIGLPQFKGDFESSPLFESIKANLGKGSLEQAEQPYSQLWRILLQQRLSWNKELYEQLSFLSRQFSSALNYAYDDVRRKAGSIYELISRARAALKEGKKEMPFKLYSEIEGISNSIPNVFFEEKRVIGEQIVDFYKELKSTTDSELIKRVSALVQEISQLIDRINTSIRVNDIANAVASYDKCIELYSQMPEGFLKHKNPLGMRILEIYKSLGIYIEISNLQKQLQPSQQSQPQFQQPAMTLSAKKEHAKRSIEKGLYDEALKSIQEAIQIEPGDAEAKAIYAKIRALQ